jgi:hypothetical protein
MVDDEPGTILERLGLNVDDEARELADELRNRRFAVSRDGDEVFVYTATYDDAQRASELAHLILSDQGSAGIVGSVERWLEDEERWSDERPDESWEAEELEEGHAPWEVRVDLGSRDTANELADTLEQEGYRPLRRWSYLIVGTATREEAEALAARLHGQVEPGGDLVYDTAPGNPFAIFGGLGGTGTPL